MSPPSGRMLGRYRLEDLLGRGGMAEVFRAEDTRLGRPVAVKVILADHAADPSFVERFLREARLVASLEHPNILPVYDFGEEGGRPYLVMPFLDGGTLRDRIQGGPVPLAKASSWITQLAGALDAAHEAGILHRDVKPANVLLGRGERVFLADFGIAKMLETVTGLTSTGMVMGTPIYMAPEQAQGKPATPATDRYALAVVGYEMLAGRPPFEGENPLSLMHQHVSSLAPALSVKAAGLPAGLDDVFERALSKEPSGRHATTGAFAAAVAAFVPTGAAAAVKTIPSATARTVLSPERLRSVTTPPPGLTSDETIASGEARPRKKLVRVGLGGLAAAVIILGSYFLLRGKGSVPAPRVTEALPTPTATAVTIPTMAPPSGSISKEPAAPVSAAEAVKIAELEARLRKAEKEIAAGARVPASATPVPVVPAPAPTSPPAAEISAAGNLAKKPGGGALRPAFERLDPSRKPDARLSKGDFEFALDAARRALKENPDMPGARFLEILAEGGLSYVARRDKAASQAVVEAFAYSKRATQKDLGHLGFLVHGPGGAIVPPTGWELALAYGDARGEAEALLAEALAKRPNEAKALLGRAYLRRTQGRMSEAIADLRHAVASRPTPAVRQGVLEILRTACRNGVAEACTEAEQMAAAAPRARGRVPAQK
ncbi:MAG: protein kinase [Thermoanaerobaculia bacterium]